MRSRSARAVLFWPSVRPYCFDKTVTAKRSTSANHNEMEVKDFVDTVLRQYERRTVIGQGAIETVEVNQVAANAPCEDHHSQAYCAMSDGWLFGVFDGHAGSACSRQTARRLYDYICASLMPRHHHTPNPDDELLTVDQRVRWLYTTADKKLPTIFRDEHLKNVQRFLVDYSRDTEPKTVRHSLKAAFTRFDDDVSLQAHPNSEGKVSRAHVAVAAAGSCACVAHVRGPHLHIANTGDSTAVLGVCGPRGGWTARQLSKEHCVENPTEVERIKKEHPARELQTVLRGGRLLGSLYPLRAFGDFGYKWPRMLQEIAFHPVYGKHITPAHLDTPPYLTASPEVFYHKLTPNDRFLVIASDGLWEMLSPDAVVRLVSDHMIGRQTLGPYVAQTDSSIKDIIQDLRVRKAGYDKQVIDENVSTHLIRHALGGHKSSEQYKLLAETLQLPAGVARNFRDDISILVVYFDQQYLSAVKTDPHPP